MTYKGHIKNGALVLDEPAELPEGAMSLSNWRATLVHPKNRSLFIHFVRAIEAHPNTTVHFVSPHLFQQGLNLYEKHTGKEWPLVDCVSFLLMEQEGIQEALTADHHFEQAGFGVLLKT